MVLVLLVLLLLLMLLAGVLQHVGTDCAGDSTTESTEQAASGLVRSPSGSSAAD